VTNFKYKLKTDIAIFEIKKEPLGLWDLWVNSMPTLTFESPEDAVNAVINKNTGYSVWDIQENLNYDKLKIENWIKIEI